jgi:serine/threonine protein kinase
MAQDASAQETGRIGQYRLLQRLGEGGMGVVHLAVDRSGRAVAIKVLRPHVADDPDARLRLTREVATLRRVHHPRVAVVLDADVDGEVPYLVTSFVPGKPLDIHVRDHGPLPRGHVARVGAVLADALRAIHDVGVVHRDLKPANVMLLDGEPVLIDFGIAHVADESRITHTGLVMGTPGYLSPEIIGGEAVTAATDWWGWGATLAFAATGRPPFGTGPIEVILDRVRRGACDIEGVDAGLRATLTSALSVDPRRRPRPELLVAGLAAAAPARSRVPSMPLSNPPTRLPAAATRVLPGVEEPMPIDAVTKRVPPPDQVVTEVVASYPGAYPNGYPPAAAPGSLSPNGYARFGDGTPNGVKSPAYGTPGQAAPGYAAPGYAAPGHAAPGPSNGFNGAAAAPPGVITRPPVPPPSPAPAAPATAPWQGADAEHAEPESEKAPAAYSRGVALGILVTLASVAAVAPYGAVWIAGIAMMIARVIDRTHLALSQRRDMRGRSGSSDSVVTLLALPWRVATCAAATVLWLILPLLVGISVAFIAASLSAGAPARAIPGTPGPLAAGMVALLVTAWWGPGGGPVRRGTSRAARFTCRGRRSQLATWGVLILVLVSALVTGSGQGPDWGPLQGSRVVQQLSLN